MIFNECNERELNMNAIQEFKQNLIEMKSSLEPILKSDTDKFIQIASNYIENNEDLLLKNRQSLYAAIFRAAQNVLYIDGQESALVPFKEKVKFMSMYKGLLKQVRNSGELDSINCGIVYENDSFESFTDENGEHLKHVPTWKDRGKPIISYCIARIKGGKTPYIEIMPETEIQECKKASRAGSDSPWNGPFSDEMRKKTVLRRISKRLPMSTDLNASLHADDDLFIPSDDEEKPKTEQPEITSDRLHNAIQEAKTEQKKIEPTPEQHKNESIEGLIDELKEITKDGKPRFGCKVSGSWFGTGDVKLWDSIKDFYNFKFRVRVEYKKVNEKNEIAHVVVLTSDDVPI